MESEDIKEIKINKLKEYVIILMKNTKRLSTANLLFLIAISFLLFFIVGNRSGYTEKENVAYESLKDNNIKITFGGDVSPSRYLKETSKKYGHDVYYRDIKSIWEDSDISVINLKATALEDVSNGENYLMAQKSSDIYLDVGVEDVQAIKDAKINLIGFANNHSMDYGVQGMEESLDIFEKIGIDIIGGGRNINEAAKPYTKSINGQSVGIMAITDVIVNRTMARNNIPGTNQTQYLHMDSNIQAMVEKNDFNIVYINWGKEYTIKPDKKIQELGRYFIDLGVDLVVGTHPHVLLPVEKYKDGMIIYSLGNLVFDQKIGRTTDSTIVNLYLDEKERCLEFVPIDIKNGIPYKTESRRKTNRIIKTLTKQLDKNSYEIEGNKLILHF